MLNKRDGLLAQMEADAADHKIPLSSLLQRCIVLGGQAGSAKMRDWARQELHGYGGSDTVPDYRHVPAALVAAVTNRTGYNSRPVRFDDSVFPSQIREIIREKVDLEEAILSQGTGQLEAMASEGTRDHQLLPPWAGFIADTMNKHDMVSNGRVADVYLSVPNVAIQGVLVSIRTALADLIAELIALTPRDQELPDNLAADQVIQLVITGNRNVINYSPQHASVGGTNVRVADGATFGPVSVSGAHGTAIGSQTASGAGSSAVGTQSASGEGSSVAGGQAVHAGHDAVAAGRNAAVPGAVGQPAKEGWWARLRKRGAVVAFFIIIGAIASVAGVVVAILLAAGWKP
jgi:AbiTii